MKKIFLTTTVMLLCSSVCFAQLVKKPGATRPVTPRPAAAMAPKPVAQTVAGKVKSVSVANANIVIMDSMGKDETLSVAPTTMISQAGKQITLDKITQSESVRIQYMATPKGTKQALIIQVAG